MKPDLEIEVVVKRRERTTSPSERGKSATVSPARIPRISRLLALAIKFQDMVDRGEVRDYADLARLGLVTRARLTQIMNLLLLAPDIQEQLLFSSSGEVQFVERDLRNIVALPWWPDQHKYFNKPRG